MQGAHHLRWWIAGILCVATALNYLDRQALSVLAATIQRDLRFSDADYSYITSSFLLSYCIMYAVSGRLVDWLGVRRSFIVFVLGWSVASMLHGLARNLLEFCVCRFLLGIGESGNFPAGVKAVAEWFPMRERALAIGIFNSGTSIGAAFAVPVVSIVTLAWGWRSAFLLTGALGVAWVGLWIKLYHPPEADLLEREPSASKPVALRTLLTMKETWGCVSARVLIDPVTYFLVFWIPKYLQKERGFSLTDVGAYAWIPYVAVAAGMIAGGALPQYLTGHGWRLSPARKGVMLFASCFVPLCYIGLIRAASPVWAMVLICGAMFGHGAWNNITLPAEVFPKTVVATVSGIGGSLGALAGVLTQLGIGRVVQDASFTPVFIVCGFTYLIAFALMHWLIGDLGRIRAIAPATAPIGHLPAR